MSSITIAMLNGLLHFLEFSFFMKKERYNVNTSYLIEFTHHSLLSSVCVVLFARNLELSYLQRNLYCIR